MERKNTEVAELEEVYMSYITVENLEKNYIVYGKKFLKREKKIIKALDKINFKVEKGEFLGYIGPNGAGKSTTIKIISGIMTPDSGEVKVGEYIPYKQRKKYVKNIGVVFGQKTQMWWDLPVIDTYNLLKGIYKIDEKKYKNNLSYIIEKLNLKEILTQPVRQLSLGQRMRAEIGASMIHDPEILFLDEPTIGLDIVTKHKVLNFLKELNEKGKTIFLTTHDLDDIEVLCKEILIINKGTVVYKGTMKGLNTITKIPTILKISLKENSMNSSNDFLIKKYNAVYDQEANRIEIIVDADKKTADIAKEFFQHFDIEDFKVEDPDIEDIIKNIYEI
jgi:ABC-2 type transport system ATP-binding protein